MYPNVLHVDKKEDGIFEMCPHLKEFKKDERQLQRDHEKSNKENKGTSIRPVNTCYKSKTGVTYGLYQRFYWDESNVPFGGQPKFRSQGGVDPCKYNGPTDFKTAHLKGGKFSTHNKQKEVTEGPNPTSYFGLGRSELNTEAAHKFDRDRRILPGEQYMQKPDYNNVLFHKDKGRGVKHDIKAYKFSDSMNLPP